MSSILAFGNLTLDDVVTTSGQIAPAQLGGNGVYAAAGIRLWGEPVALLAAVGNDFPLEWLEQLEAAGIDIRGVNRLEIPHQLRSRVFYLPDGRRTDRVEEAAPFLPPGVEQVLDLVTAYTEMGSALHRQYWPLFSPTPDLICAHHLEASAAHLAPGPVNNNRANAAYLKQHARNSIVLGLDWPWWDWDGETVADEALLRNIDYLLPSQEELAIHAGAEAAAGLDETAERLLAYGPRAVVVKQGAHGVRLRDGRASGWQTVGAFPTRVVDPTGAGDAFCGGFMVGITRTQDPFRAACYGAVSASFVIENFGVLHALEVRPEQAEARLQYLLNQVLPAKGPGTTRHA